MMQSTEVVELFRRSGAFVEGHFVLASGRHTNVSVQGALVMRDPATATELANALATPFRFAGVTAVMGAGLGGALLAYEVARCLSVPAVFAVNLHGVMQLAPGFALTAADSVLVVEDVVDTGATLSSLLELVQSHGAQSCGSAVLLDRSDDAGHRSVNPFTLARFSFPTYATAECPHCEVGTPLRRPL